MRYGAMNFPVNPILPELKKISDLGFDYLELALDPPCAHYAIVLDMEKELVQALGQYSLGLVCHLPTFVYTADLTPAIREISLKEIIHSLETAARINAEKVVLHPSFISGLGPFVMDTALGYARKSLAAIVKKAENLGMDLCFENMYPKYHSFFAPEQFARVFKEFPPLKMTLDTGYNDTITLEIFSPDPGDLRESRDKIAGMFQSSKG